MTLTKQAKYLTIVAALFAVIIFGSATLAHANPFYTGSKAQSATATSTQTYLRIGAATSTTVYDSYEQYGTNQTNQANITIPDVVSWVLDGVASTTSSVVNAACEYSDNYNGSTGNGDWYQNESGLLSYSTTTIPVNISLPYTYTFTYASSTVGGAGLSGSNNRFQKIVTCPINTRYVRLVVTNTGSPVSVWVQAIPKKQRNSGN
jgi:hypothetical protein